MFLSKQSKGTFFDSEVGKSAFTIKRHYFSAAPAFIMIFRPMAVKADLKPSIGQKTSNSKPARPQLEYGFYGSWVAIQLHKSFPCNST